MKFTKIYDSSSFLTSRSSSILHRVRVLSPKTGLAFVENDTAMITRWFWCNVERNVAFTDGTSGPYDLMRDPQIASLNRIAAAIRGNPDLARHGTRFIGNLAIGPHLGCELATCIANKRSPRVENNDIVTDHYAAGAQRLLSTVASSLSLFPRLSSNVSVTAGGRDQTYSLHRRN